MLHIGNAQVNLDSIAKPKKVFGFAPLADSIPKDKSGLFVLPLLYYTPDTRWAAGAAGVYYFKVKPKLPTDELPRVSYLQFLADYTQNKQLDTWATWQVFTRNENFLLKGDIRYRDFPDRFYGIGNNTDKTQEEKYSYNLFVLKSLQLKKIKPGFFLGFDYELEYEYGFNYTPGGQLENGSITGYQGGVGSALGLVGVIDTRDNIINPYKGRLAEVSTYFFTQPLGSTFSFQVLNGVYQQYWQLKPKHILAFQFKSRFSFGDVPFLDLSTLGNDDILRGYPKNRFRDRHFAATQLEYRFPLWWRFGAVAFAGVGDVFGPNSDLSTQNLKYSIGTGLRFVVDPAERLNIRLDYGYGTEGGYFYFVVGEAF
ncbi:MAG: BamA/TamA family outer membrane protein [Crocinitomicaceae bacterium]|nr:BamA/TamA family outer membrane protein [Crocinitomicaceae bacterium]